MDIITRLASQSQNISPAQSEILREMANRDNTAKIVKEYVLSRDEDDEEDDDDGEGGQGGKRGRGNGGRMGGMSDTAYYHSLGKGL